MAEASQAAWLDLLHAEVTHVLSRSGTPSLVLKGPSVANWLYSTPRAYSDVDLLISPANLAIAREALMQRGFRLTERVGEAGGHAANFRRLEDDAAVDLHIAFPGVRRSASSAWPVWWRERVEAELAHVGVLYLREPARLVTLCLHSARNGADNVQSLEDVERSLMLSGEIWAQAAALARELQAEDGLVAALSMTEAGRQRATELGLTSGVTGAWRLRTANGRPESIRLLEIVESRGYRRWRLIFNEMFPSRAYLAGHWPRAREGARGLAWTYLLRWLHLARAMPSAIRDVVATRRRV